MCASACVVCVCVCACVWASACVSACVFACVYICVSVCLSLSLSLSLPLHERHGKLVCSIYYTPNWIHSRERKNASSHSYAFAGHVVLVLRDHI